MANQRFDFNEANRLKTQLTTEINKIESDLKHMMTMVEGVRNWWSGGSEEAFIQNFRGTKDKIEKSLNECIADYQRLIDQIARVKQESDADIARQLRM
ncbi:MAG: hypothetical protein PHZ11_10175 [Desulfitobacteriaceae bacterium]|nr:hypothetical protein [Desulfitobacteriaceae bacterium]MDD4347222.1 hypothetical protein [Desulfitobacteriaceae bacterium]MDD4401886.1 hypothetical protein [Desulfitobacteriaceae bacterium]